MEMLSKRRMPALAEIVGAGTKGGKTMNHPVCLATIAVICQYLGRPVTGSLAAMIWAKSNFMEPPDLAALWMESCGYIPWQGYPLIRRVK